MKANFHLKKATLGLLLILSLLICFGGSALAADLDLVTDEAYLLTDEEYYELNDLAYEISQEYGCEVAIVTIDDMGDDDAYDYAKWIYNEYNYGYGSDRSCLLFFLSMAERDYALVAYGYGNTAFTDHGKDVLLDTHVLPLLAKDQYYEAFTAYLNTSAEYLQMARDGSPFDVNTDPANARTTFLIKLAVTILLPLLIAGLLCLMWKNQMKTAKQAAAADNYIPAGGFQLTGQEDLFLYRTETRRTIEKKSSGGTTTDRDGASGRSGKF